LSAVQLLSFDQAHFIHEQSQVFSPDSYVTIGMIRKYRTQPTCIEYIDTIVGMRFDQWPYWDSWKFVGRPWRYQNV